MDTETLTEISNQLDTMKEHTNQIKQELIQQNEFLGHSKRPSVFFDSKEIEESAVALKQTQKQLSNIQQSMEKVLTTMKTESDIMKKNQPYWYRFFTFF